MRSRHTTRSPCTHCARSLSGEHTTTRSTEREAAKRAAAVASASSHSNSTIGHVTIPSARHASSARPNCSYRTGSMPSPGLVAGIQVVAKRLDDVIERDGDVRDVALAEQCEHRARKPAGGADFLAALVDARRAAVVSPEELERAVDEMHVHACVPLGPMCCVFAAASAGASLGQFARGDGQCSSAASPRFCSLQPA